MSIQTPHGGETTPRQDNLNESPDGSTPTRTEAFPDLTVQTAERVPNLNSILAEKRTASVKNSIDPSPSQSGTSLENPQQRILSDNSQLADSSEAKEPLIKPLKGVYPSAMVLSKNGVLTRFGKMAPDERRKYREDMLAGASAMNPQPGVLSDNSELANSSEVDDCLLQPTNKYHDPPMILSKHGELTKFGKMTPDGRQKYREDKLAEANAIIAKKRAQEEEARKLAGDSASGAALPGS
jgi:hypothetical protein